jgi:Rrf2 family protein
LRLSTKTRYGVRAIFDIAYHAQDQPHGSAQARDIARREQIPLRYLEQIFQDLRRAGLVESKRGPRGGYSLKRDPASITLADVVRALQGPIEAMVAALDEEGGRGEEPNSRALMTSLWQDLARDVTAWFSGVTIADLVRRGNQLGVPRGGVGTPMYFI